MARSSLSVSSPSSYNSKKALLEVANALETSTLHCAGNIVTAWSSAVDTARVAWDSLLGAYRHEAGSAQTQSKGNLTLSGLRRRVRKITPAHAVESVFSSLSTAVAFTSSLLMVTATMALIGAYVVSYSVVMVCTNAAYSASIVFGSGGSNVAMMAVKDLQQQYRRIRGITSVEDAVKKEPVYANINELEMVSKSDAKHDSHRVRTFCKNVALGLLGLLAFSAVFVAVAAGAATVVVVSPLLLVAASIYEVLYRQRDSARVAGALCDGYDARLLPAAVETGKLESGALTHKNDKENTDKWAYNTQESVAAYSAPSLANERCTSSVGNSSVPGWSTRFWPGEEGEQQHNGGFSTAGEKNGSAFCESGAAQSIFGQANYIHVHERSWGGHCSGSDRVGTRLHDVTTESCSAAAARAAQYGGS